MLFGQRATRVDAPTPLENGFSEDDAAIRR
jgi:hypothetical protein